MLHLSLSNWSDLSPNTDGLNESKKVNYSDYTIRIEVIFSGSNPGWFYEYSESTEKYE